MKFTLKNTINFWFGSNPTLPLLALSLACIVTGCATGCASTTPKPVAWTITITKPPGIEVDIVGVTQREKLGLQGYAVDKYWSPGDRERKNADKLTSPPRMASWSVSAMDPVWKKWVSKGEVCVIANLPGTFEGAVDARREFLTLDKKHWVSKNRNLEILVLENRIQILTPEKPQ